MLANPSGKFQTLVTRLLSGHQYHQALEQAAKLYQIKQYNIQQLVPNKIHQMYYLITTKFYFNRKPGDNQAWYENELRVFIWLLIGYAFLEGKHVSELKSHDWKYFSEIFNQRNPDIFEFQSKSILKRDNKGTRWDREQVDLLDSLIKSKSIKNKWNQIAKELFIRSGKKFFRTAKQCRQHWINHLNPTTVRAAWSSYEDLQLVESVQQHGKKWSKVSKALGGKRTEHMVKNRYKSLFHFETKRYDKKKLQNREVEEEILRTMIYKLKMNIEEGEKLSYNYVNKDDRQNEEKQIFYDEQHQPNFHDLIDQKSVLEHDAEELNLKNNWLNFQVEEQQNFYSKINQLFQEDCVNIFFHDSYNTHQ